MGTLPWLGLGVLAHTYGHETLGAFGLCVCSHHTSRASVVASGNFFCIVFKFGVLFLFFLSIVTIIKALWTSC